MAQLINNADVSGKYQTMTVTDKTQLIVELSALSIVKKADKQLWLTNDELTYTIEVTNVDAAEPGDPVTAVAFKDTIDPKIATLVTTSVTVDGDPKTLGVDFNYDPLTGLLSFATLGDIEPGDTVVISFRVKKVWRRLAVPEKPGGGKHSAVYRGKQCGCGEKRTLPLVPLSVLRLPLPVPMLLLLLPLSMLLSSGLVCVQLLLPVQMLVLEARISMREGRDSATVSALRIPWMLGMTDQREQETAPSEYAGVCTRLSVAEKWRGPCSGRTGGPYA